MALMNKKRNETILTIHIRYEQIKSKKKLSG